MHPKRMFDWGIDNNIFFFFFFLWYSFCLPLNNSNFRYFEIKSLVRSTSSLRLYRLVASADKVNSLNQDNVGPDLDPNCLTP